MAKIQYVDYEAIPGQAKEMRSCGKQLNSEVTKIYSSVEEMHGHWYGIRYNELVKGFNNLIPRLNEMLTLVVTELPYALETIANNYSLADKGTKITVASSEGPNKLTNLPIINDVGMKFITTSVHEKQQSISANLKNAKEQMDRIESIYLRVQWQSEAAEAFKARLSKLKNEIVASFESLNTDFVRLMEQTQKDIEIAENANKVD